MMSSQPQPVVEVTPQELAAEIQRGAGLVLLDCREDWEWNSMHLPGSLHIPVNQIPARLAELDRQSQIVVICAHGQRSYWVAGYLLERGFQARSLSGGLAAWPRR